MTRDESRDVYQLFVERTARTATIITSNRDTADWLALFDDPLLGQSAVDRFKNLPVLPRADHDRRGRPVPGKPRNKNARARVSSTQTQDKNLPSCPEQI